MDIGEDFTRQFYPRHIPSRSGLRNGSLRVHGGLSVLQSFDGTSTGGRLIQGGILEVVARIPMKFIR